MSFSHIGDTSNCIFGYFPVLQYFDISNTNARETSKDIFQYAPNLVHLVAHGNYFGLVKNGLEFLSSAPNLLELDISYNRLISPSLIYIESLQHLQKLLISGNSITSLDNLSISNLPNLTLLDLQSNKITSLSDKVITEWELVSRRQNLSIDLSDNPFVCDCSTLETIEWIHSTHVQLLNRKKYHCSYRNKKVLIGSTIRHLSDQCGIMNMHTFDITNKNVLIVTIPAVSVTFVCCFVLVYFCRWKLRWKLYKLKKAVHSNNMGLYPGRLIEIDNAYMYDAYVASDDEDIQWVTNHLIPKVEKEWHLLLLVKLRDFLAGGSNADNIIEGIDRSEKTLLILTNAFLRSKWGDFEVQMAVTKDYNTIIPCVMEDLNPSFMSNVMKRLLKSNSCVEWTDDDDGQALFWHKLRHLLFNED